MRRIEKNGTPAGQRGENDEPEEAQRALRVDQGLA